MLHTDLQTLTLSCSREDFAVLETEYQKNARPDKATRLDIVQRVSLTEKEVQVRAEEEKRLECFASQRDAWISYVSLETN